MRPCLTRTLKPGNQCQTNAIYDSEKVDTNQSQINARIGVNEIKILKFPMSEIEIHKL
jgi:hypothetical protein